jgi:hypothetical protein
MNPNQWLHRFAVEHFAVHPLLFPKDTQVVHNDINF